MQNWKDRQGVWVETDLGVGVRQVETVKLGESQVPVRVAYVHLVDADGVTIAQVPETSAGNVRQARRGSIPAARIAGLSEAQLARLGYEQ